MINKTGNRKSYNTKNLLWNRFSRLSLVVFVSLGIMGFQTDRSIAEVAQTAPKDLVKTISEIEKAANTKNIKGVIDYYSSDFTSSDGLTKNLVSDALIKTWTNYPQLRYSTKIESWKRSGDNLIAETTTLISGSQKSQGKLINLESTLRSRQYFKDNKLIRQEILSEKTQLKSGSNPPVVETILPETVKVGQKYNFDVIVSEPLGDNVLLGAAKEERTGSDRYLNPSNLELEQLQAGGIFKQVTAPPIADNHWLSAILVRGDGMTMVTQRVIIED